MNQVIQTIKARRSIRKYTDQQISDDHLNAILEAGLYAPTAHNQQPWHFTVIQKPEVLALINKKTRDAMLNTGIEWMTRMASKEDFKVTYNAPTLIVVSGKKDAMAMEADCSAAIQNMLVAAESLDIGSVWLGLVRLVFQDEEVKNALNIPEDYKPYYSVSFGHKAQDKALPAPRRNRDVIQFIR
ncbi:MAG: nitroreductase family protein [Clostridia bacterium]|nr:nitroreductase family protein [Clostridia bacterium]